MIIATAVVAETGKDLDYVLWDMPAAVALQIFYLHRQREGVELVVDDTGDIRAILAKQKSNGR